MIQENLLYLKPKAYATGPRTAQHQYDYDAGKAAWLLDSHPAG